MKEKSKKILYLFLGWLFLILGIIGAFLPLLPTTPFLLLAAYFFSHSSEKVHQKLLNHKTFGPLIKDWEEKGIIRRKAKLLATVAMVALFSLSFYFMSFTLMIKILLMTIASTILAFIWTRPES